MYGVAGDPNEFRTRHVHNTVKCYLRGRCYSVEELRVMNPRRLNSISSKWRPRPAVSPVTWPERSDFFFNTM